MSLMFSSEATRLAPDGFLPERVQEYELIAGWLQLTSQKASPLEDTPQTLKVLDLGCGEGGFLYWLEQEHQIRGQGIELDANTVMTCLEKGLSVVQDDLESALEDYPDNAFDLVVMNHTLQALKHPIRILDEMLRVGQQVVLGFPNFAYREIRWSFFQSGRMPKSKTLPFEWYDTPNIHLFTITDFVELCKQRQIHILDARYHCGQQWKPSPHPTWWTNWTSDKALFLLKD